MNGKNADAAFWNRIAGKYARNPVKDQASYDQTLAATLALTTPDSIVYEVGCGTGSTALHIANKAARVVATDIAEEMIGIARSRAADMNNVEFRIAPADAEGAAEAFDLAICFNTLHLVPDRQRALEKIHHVLKQGGYFVSKTPCLWGVQLVLAPLIGLMAALGKAPRVFFFDRHTLIGSIEAAGFEIVSVAAHDAKRPQARPFIVARKR